MLRPASDGSFVVAGAYPPVHSKCRRPRQPSLDARYPGTITVTRASDGTLTVAVTLPFERYLDGIAEMPSSWPPAALQAQAVAARTYALAQTGWTGAPGETLKTPICASTSCQVYRGLPITQDSSIGRWYDAVQHTAGSILVSGGRPAQTLYFSTSNGTTHGNDEIFHSAPLPYLRPVPERDDGASPESHWRVSLPLRDLTAFLRAAGAWPVGPPGGAISTVGRNGSKLTVSGHGISRSMDVGAFAAAVNAWASCLKPDAYPQPSRLGAPLPLAVPSVWFDVARQGGTVVLTGRGWGHGVGMVQWGAYGKAVRGLSAAQILAYYYGGMMPQTFPEPPTITVQVAAGLTSLMLEPSGPGATIDGRALAGGSVVITGGDALRVTEQPG